MENEEISQAFEDPCEEAEKYDTFVDEDPGQGVLDIYNAAAEKPEHYVIPVYGNLV